MKANNAFTKTAGNPAGCNGMVFLVDSIIVCSDYGSSDGTGNLFGVKYEMFSL